jgi:hypothetical protein
MAWDVETGAPARERLSKLGLAELAADIAQG